MSAFLCSAAHLSALIDAAPVARLHVPDPQALFAELLEQNLRSLAARYPSDDADNRKTACGWRYASSRNVAQLWDDTGQFRPVVAVKLARCYDYQACEHGDAYDGTEAKRYVDAICAALVPAGKNPDSLPGYSAAPWGL